MKRDAINFENEKVSVLFRKLLIPTLFGTISMSAVTAIDGIFVGQGVGATGVAAVNIVVPVYQIMSGLGLMIGCGCSVVASIYLARQNIKVAQLNVTQSVLVVSVVTILLSALMWWFPHQTAEILGSSDTLMSQVVDYLIWITPSYLFEIWTFIGLFIIRLDGSPRYAMWCNIVPALLNVFFDWLFIFPLGMGVKGAAMATSICHIAGGTMALVYLLRDADTLRLIPLKMSVKSFMLTMRNIGYQCKVCSSTLFGELTLAVLIFMGNYVFMNYLGDAGVGAFGIACYYTPFFFMVGNAIAQSAQPIISYNYGATKWKEVKETRKLLYITSLGIGVIITILFVLIPDKLVALFVDPQSKSGQIAISGFPFYAVGIIFFILNVSIIGYYQSIEEIKKSTLFVFLRGCFFLIPSFILLPKLLGMEGIWMAMPAAEIMTVLVVIAMLLRSRL